MPTLLPMSLPRAVGGSTAWIRLSRQHRGAAFAPHHCRSFHYPTTVLITSSSNSGEFQDGSDCCQRNGPSFRRSRKKPNPKPQSLRSIPGSAFANAPFLSAINRLTATGATLAALMNPGYDPAS